MRSAALLSMREFDFRPAIKSADRCGPVRCSRGFARRGRLGLSLFFEGTRVPAHTTEPKKKAGRLDDFLEDLGGKHPKEPKRGELTKAAAGKPIT